MFDFFKNAIDYLINEPQVVASILALIGVLLTILKTSSNNKRSIKTTARIDWIQKVRNEVSELLALYSCINESPIPNDTLYQIEKKTNLLILYLGPDSSKDAKSPNNDKEQGSFPKKLLKENSNSGKNQHIVKFLENLINALKDYSRNDINRAFDTVENLRNRLIERGVKFNDDRDIIKDLIPDDSDDVYELLKDYDEADAFYNELSQKCKRIKKDIVILRDCFRIYFKIEWNQAKKGC